MIQKKNHPLLHPFQRLLIHSPIYPLKHPPLRTHAQAPHHHHHLQPSWRRPSCLRPARPRRRPASRCRPRRRWTASRGGRCAEPGRGGPTARPSSATRAPRWSSLRCPCSKVRDCSLWVTTSQGGGGVSQKAAIKSLCSPDVVGV